VPTGKETRVRSLKVGAAEKPGRPALPEGYRLVAVASDNWVLVGPRGSWVASYRGGLDLWRATLDANKHDRARSRAL
jgi:hypothetical protein